MPTPQGDNAALVGLVVAEWRISGTMALKVHGGRLATTGLLNAPVERPPVSTPVYCVSSRARKTSGGRPETHEPFRWRTRWGLLHERVTPWPVAPRSRWKDARSAARALSVAPATICRMTTTSIHRAGVRAHPEEEAGPSVDQDAAQVESPNARVPWWRVAARVRNVRLARLGFTEEELSGLTSAERDRLARWLPPRRLIVPVTFLVMFFASPSVVIAVLRRVPSTPIAGTGTGSAPMLDRATAVMQALAVLFFLAVIIGMVCQSAAERFGDQDRALGVVSRWLLRESQHPAAIGLTHRRRIARHARACVTRARRAGMEETEVVGLVADPRPGAAAVAAKLRQLLLRHVRGLTVVLDVPEAQGHRSLARWITAGGVTAIVSAAATVLSSWIGTLR